MREVVWTAVAIVVGLTVGIVLNQFLGPPSGTVVFIGYVVIVAAVVVLQVRRRTRQ